MKLRYLFASLAAAAALFAGCSDDDPISLLEGLEVSNDYVTVAADNNSSATITIVSEEAWTASVTGADWVSLSPASGSAGQSSLTITASEASTARSAEIYINAGTKTKIVSFNQSAPQGVEVPTSTVEEIFNGPDKNYKVTGTITKIVNTHYGNWYLNDGTVEGDGLYVYGTLDKKGGANAGANAWDNINDPNYENSWTLGVGDVVTIEGPKSVYNGVVELVDVTITKVVPSLIDAYFEDDVLPTAAGEAILTVESKVQPVLVTVDADWIQVKDLTDDGNYILAYEENLRTASRTATVTIKAPGAIKAIQITQEGVPSTGMSVTEIIAAEDDDQVQTLPSTVVVALTTRGAVVSDGQSALYVYGADAAALKIGDGVRIAGKKATYNGVPEITDLTEVFVDSEENEVFYPDPTDITATVAEYTASVAEYVKLAGKVSISDDVVNVILDGIDPETLQGRISYPVSDLDIAAFDGKNIIVTGYFNGISGGGKVLNIIATKVTDDNPKGTLKNPYTASEVAELLTQGTKIDENVYVKGIVSAILYDFSTYNGTGTFWISDDGTFNGSEDKKTTTDFTHDFECYSVLWFGNEDWTEGKAQVEVGDEVVICGRTTLYKGIAETSSKSAWLYSVNGATTDENGLGNANSPFNVDGAVAFIDAMQEAIQEAKDAGNPAPVFPDVCVGGKISKIQSAYSAEYGTAIFWISEDGEFKDNPQKDFEAYSVYYFGGESWNDGDKQIAVGDDVVIKGQLTKYKTTYETSSKKARLFSLNGETE